MKRPVRRLVLVAAAVLAVATLPAVTTLGAQAAPAAPADHGKRRVSPEHYSAVNLDVGALRAQLSRAPGVKSRGSLAFSVPTPAGGTERFSVQRTTVMQSKLAAAHPEIATYAGRSLEHPGTTVALDVTPMGFHASVRGPNGQGAWYVDPAYDKRGTTRHLSYYGAAVDSTDAQDFVERETRDIQHAVADRSAARAGAGGVVHQRLYRLALTSDPSYAAYFGTENVLAEKVTLINRVNQIYNDDMAISLRLVNATDDLNLDTDAKATGPDGPCGAHACFDLADPGDPDSYGQLDFCDVGTLGRNRTVLGQIVGASNYDIGHIALGVNGGGVAYLGVVGWDYKGGGCTGLPQPKGDFFAIDYVAHEMGHQFAGNHTFDGAQYACSGGNREPSTSVEPGSGSSVMAYAGICLQDDLQPHTDPYFSQRTIDEVSAYTGDPIIDVNEVQTVSLSGFGTDGDQITLDFPGSSGPVTLTRGVDYDAAGIEAAVEQVTGLDVSIAGWGYDPYGSYVDFPAPLTAPDDTGFQVIFNPSLDPEAPTIAGDVDSLSVTSATSGVTGFVGETAKGGTPDNIGSTVVTTHNHAPKVHAPAGRKIPARTPFRLTGRGSDRDGDALTYLWEQNDVGGAQGTELVDNHKVLGPLFRVFGTAADVTDEGTLETPSPGENHATKSGAERTFPDLAQVLAGNTDARTGRCPKVAPLPGDLDDYTPVRPKAVECYSEFLPGRHYRGSPGSASPRMHFRLTARDGYPNGGGTGHDDVVIKVDSKAGPFLVTSQSHKHASVKGGKKSRVAWKVHGTKHLAKKVRILLSLNGGKSWRTLDNKTANDGHQKVKFPRHHTKKARIMVEARGNYFFAVNQRPFRIR